MSTPDTSGIKIKPIIGKDQGIVAKQLKQYQALRSKLVTGGGPGADIAKKYDIAPYLKRQDAWYGQLKEFDRLRTQYVELTDKVIEADKGEIPLPEREKLQKDWMKVGGQVEKLGTKGLRDVGEEFQKNLLDFDETVKNFVDELDDAETESLNKMTQKQTKQLADLLRFLNGTRAHLRSTVSLNFDDYVQKTIESVASRKTIA